MSVANSESLSSQNVQGHAPVSGDEGAPPEPQPNNPPASDSQRETGCVRRLVRCLCDTVSTSQVSVKGCENANLYAKRGWELYDTSVKYIYDGLGGFDSYFIFHMKNSSGVFSYFGEAKSGNIFKRAIARWCWALSARINKNPSFGKQISYRDGMGYVRF